MKNTFFLLALTLATASVHANPKFRPYFERLRESQVALAGPPVTVKEAAFKQTLDHGSVSDQRTFTQRYWTSSTYSKGASAPTLLYICGEGKCGSGALMYGPMGGWAKSVGGNLIAIEHRYYGLSQPFTDLSSEHLQYLTTSQAMSDILKLKRSLAASGKFTGPWIALGGSYAGNLAAYLRSRFPSEFSMALASSAPAQADRDFAEYDRYVGKLAGPSCALKIREVVAGIETRASTTAGFADLQKRFVEPGVHHVGDFIYLMSDIASAAIQLGLKEEFCDQLGRRGLDGYVDMKLKVDKQFGRLADYTAEEAANPNLAKHSGPLGMRQWFYQSCTEYGYWQNAWADPRESTRSPSIDERYHDELCQRLFGLARAANVDETNRTYYHPLLEPLATSKIFFTNGTEDPWASLSIRVENGNAVNPETPVRTITGGGHCSEFGVGAPKDAMAARQEFANLMKTWLNP